MLINHYYMQVIFSMQSHDLISRRTDSSVGRAPDYRPNGCEFESSQSRAFFRCALGKALHLHCLTPPRCKWGPERNLSTICADLICSNILSGIVGVRDWFQ